MPLRRGGQSAVSFNIRELTKANKTRTKKRPRKQIIAAAMSAARGGKKRGR